MSWISYIYLIMFIPLCLYLSSWPGHGLMNLYVSALCHSSWSLKPPCAFFHAVYLSLPSPWPFPYPCLWCRGNNPLTLATPGDAVPLLESDLCLPPIESNNFSKKTVQVIRSNVAHSSRLARMFKHFPIISVQSELHYYYIISLISCL